MYGSIMWSFGASHSHKFEKEALLWMSNDPSYTLKSLGYVDLNTNLCYWAQFDRESVIFVSGIEKIKFCDIQPCHRISTYFFWVSSWPSLVNFLGIITLFFGEKKQFVFSTEFRGAYSLSMNNLLSGSQGCEKYEADWAISPSHFDTLNMFICKRRWKMVSVIYSYTPSFVKKERKIGSFKKWKSEWLLIWIHKAYKSQLYVNLRQQNLSHPPPLDPALFPLFAKIFIRYDSRFVKISIHHVH